MEFKDVKIGMHILTGRAFGASSRFGHRTGTIVTFDGDLVGVEFDDYTYDDNGNKIGHNLDGSICSRRGRWGRAREIECEVEISQQSISMSIDECLWGEKNGII